MDREKFERVAGDAFKQLRMEERLEWGRKRVKVMVVTRDRRREPRIVSMMAAVVVLRRGRAAFEIYRQP